MNNAVPVSTEFPELSSAEEVSWAPILYHPNSGSWEVFVIGIAAQSRNESVVLVGNAISRLACIYGDNAQAPIMAIGSVAKEYENRLRETKISISDLPELFEELTLGPIQNSVGFSCSDTANLWLNTLSSFHKKSSVALAPAEVSRELTIARTLTSRAPVRVFEIISQSDKRLLGFFHEDVRKRQVKRRRANATVKIDYHSQRLSANIEKFNVDHAARAVGVIKERMWDLAVTRDAEKEWVSNLEMIVELPSSEVSLKPEASRNRIKDAILTLTEQADREEIRLHRMGSADEIATHILKKEQAA